jgi:hypothetical protein
MGSSFRAESTPPSPARNGGSALLAKRHRELGLVDHDPRSSLTPP